MISRDRVKLTFSTTAALGYYRLLFTQNAAVLQQWWWFSVRASWEYFLTGRSQCSCVLLHNLPCNNKEYRKTYCLGAITRFNWKIFIFWFRWGPYTDHTVCQWGLLPKTVETIIKKFSQKLLTVTEDGFFGRYSDKIRLLKLADFVFENYFHYFQLPLHYIITKNFKF